MAAELDQLHFVLMPLMSPSHLIPMIDIGRLLAVHNIFVTIVTTPLNAIKFSSTVERATSSGLKIQLLHLQFPVAEAGLPEGCENMDKLPSREFIRNFFNAAAMLQQPFEKLLEKLQPPPSCIISGKNLPWTVDTARKFGIPRIFFDGMGCFSFSCTHNLEVSGAHEAVVSKSEPFLVPDLPHKVELTRAKLPEFLDAGLLDLKEVRDRIRITESKSDGILVNSFEELETEYVDIYKKVKGDKVWCIGPVSASNKLDSDKAERGDKASIDAKECLNWLDKRETRSVVYACLGSICGLTTCQLIEVGLGLEASNQPFIWVIRDSPKTQGLQNWIKENGFQERTKGRGLLIRGWAPQVSILSHEAIGGFLTHCGWNSTLEGISAGVPLITCPLFAEQFCNEKLVVEVVGTGVSVGVEAAVAWGSEEKFGPIMKKEQVEKAIRKVMALGKKEAEERRERARKLGVIARSGIENGGSSYINMEKFIQYVKTYNQLPNS